MCALGWLLASFLADAIRAVDHWIALLLLAGVGIKMIWDVVSGDDEGEEATPTEKPKSPLLWAITAMGTSIDAAAVGIAFAFSGVPIWLAAPTIAIMSGTISATGFLIAPSLGTRFGERAEILGGIVLIIIGGFIFWSHQFAGHG